MPATREKEGGLKESSSSAGPEIGERQFYEEEKESKEN